MLILRKVLRSTSLFVQTPERCTERWLIILPRNCVSNGKIWKPILTVQLFYLKTEKRSISNQVITVKVWSHNRIVHNFIVAKIVVVFSKNLRKILFATERPIQKNCISNCTDKSSYDFCKKKSYLLVRSFFYCRNSFKFVLKWLKVPISAKNSTFFSSTVFGSNLERGFWRVRTTENLDNLFLWTLIYPCFSHLSFPLSIFFFHWFVSLFTAFLFYGTVLS